MAIKFTPYDTNAYTCTASQCTKGQFDVIILSSIHRSFLSCCINDLPRKHLLTAILFPAIFVKFNRGVC